ncbi:MAG: hypothetical protein OXG37_07305 [Actinomycetia bacterium]|nr:hypothetical protein [Actinomycetes bacterium]
MKFDREVDVRPPVQLGDRHTSHAIALQARIRIVEALSDVN